MDGIDAVVHFARSIRKFQSRSSFVHAIASGLTTKKDDIGVHDNPQTRVILRFPDLRPSDPMRVSLPSIPS